MATGVEPRSAPSLNIPESAHTVKVSCIDSTSRFEIPMSEFLQPDYAQQPLLHGPSYSFLIEHPTRKAILFDLGTRKDWEALPSAPKFRELKWKISVATDVAAILQENGVDVTGGAIDSIVWSHHHWDHVGDPSRFPPSTELVVGPGFVKAHLPGYPSNPNSTLLESDFAGRQVREVNFSESNGEAGTAGLQIGRFKALDYFGDGSFYLLDTPGHSVGHICGLARTTAQPPTFIFLGGDAAHHGGEFRPTEYLPLPKEVDASLLLQWRQRHPQSSTCPGHLLQDVNPHASATRPYYHVTEHFAHDKSQVEWTLAGLGEFDAQPNVLLLIAHDNTLGDGESSPAMIDLYPQSLNDWRAKGVGEQIKWTFLRDFDAALVAKEKGEPPFDWKYPAE